MAYRFEPQEPIPAAVRRVAHEEIEGALADLRRPDHDAAVHAIRKRFKRLRALLRLVRDDLGAAAAHDRVLRDAGRALAQARDRRVAWDTAQRLAEGGGPAGPALERLVAALARRTPEGPEAVDAALVGLEPALIGLRAEVDGWILADGTAAVASGLRRTIRRGRKREAEARDEPSAVRLHEWRKRVKDLWYQATLLQGVVEGLEPLIADLDTLGDTLGLDHDHAVLHDVAADPALCPDADRPLVRAAVALERARLQGLAFSIGDRVYGDAFAALLGALQGASSPSPD